MTVCRPFLQNLWVGLEFQHSPFTDSNAVICQPCSSGRKRSETLENSNWQQQERLSTNHFCGNFFLPPRIANNSPSVRRIQRQLLSFLQTASALKVWLGRDYVRTFVQNMHRTRLHEEVEGVEQQTEVWCYVETLVRVTPLDVFQHIWDLSSRVCGEWRRSGQTWCFPKPNQSISTEPSRKLNLNKHQAGTYSFNLSVVSEEMCSYSDDGVVNQWWSRLIVKRCSDPLTFWKK